MSDDLPGGEVKKRLQLLRAKCVGRPLFAEEYQQAFQEQFFEFGIDVTTHPYGDDIGINQITANGYFSSWDQEEGEDTDIELVLVLNSEDRVITINSSDWEFLEHQVTQTLAHEMIHREQAKQRIGTEYMPAFTNHMDEEQKRIVYLSDPDEIDAYANDVALDLLCHYTYMGAYGRMREYKKIRQDESPIFCEYIDTFGWNSMTVRVLVKKVLKRLET